MMEKYLNSPIILIVILLISGCGTTEIVCEQPENIQSAVETSKIVIPEELDNLSGEKELKIPRASPREPRSEPVGPISREPDRPRIGNLDLKAQPLTGQATVTLQPAQRDAEHAKQENDQRDCPIEEFAQRQDQPVVGEQ